MKKQPAGFTGNFAEIGDAARAQSQSNRMNSDVFFICHGENRIDIRTGRIVISPIGEQDNLAPDGGFRFHRIDNFNQCPVNSGAGIVFRICDKSGQRIFIISEPDRLVISGEPHKSDPVRITGIVDKIDVRRFCKFQIRCAEAAAVVHHQHNAGGYYVIPVHLQKLRCRFLTIQIRICRLRRVSQMIFG